MRCVALVINRDKPVAIEAAQGIVRWLESHAILPRLTREGAGLIDRPNLGVEAADSWAAGAEVVIVLGGDGTLIRAAKWTAPLGLPILGINTGHLGFLAELENGEVFEHLEHLLAGNAVIEERMILQVQVERGGVLQAPVTALNEAFIGKGPGAHLVEVVVSLGETTVAQYRSDGLIVATPTGSTAYSLSAGGPIVAPNVEALLLTPVCPHTMSARPMVVSSSEEVLIAVQESAGEMGLSVDGSDLIPLHRGDLVRVRKSPHQARLMRRRQNRFYEILHEKLADTGR